MLDKSITSIKGIGPRRAETLGRLGLFSLRDILYFLPRAHRDYSAQTYIMAARHGDDVAIKVTLQSDGKLARVRKGLSIVSARAYDESGPVSLTWYNQPYRAASLKAGQTVVACGRMDRTRGAKLINPSIYSDFPGILPLYPLTKGVSQNQLRDAVRAALNCCSDEIEETLPSALLEKYGLLGLASAIENLHFPHDMDTLAAARKRLAFEDMLVYRLMLSMMSDSRARREFSYTISGIKECFISLLSFSPTGAQLRAMDEISSDLTSGHVMNRLLQGDVGSGKTCVAFFAMFAAIENGKQAVIMAPTEILAFQHYAKLCEVFPSESVVCLCGSMQKKQRDAAYAAIASGEAKAIVGTHALLQSGVEFFDLGLIVTDEQHRFGVSQRAAISAKGKSPDVLIMSATPIPRTLALMLYGELAVSELDELPPGRKPIITRLVPAEKRESMYGFIDEQVKNGAQAYVVCPLVEYSDSLDEVQSAIELFDELKEKLSCSVDLLHGKMKPSAKEAATEKFRRGETGVLVATTVIEVGVDVPNARIMVIEDADRFGLAQLHQLRGRVGRGDASSWCFLLSGSDSETASERLSTLVSTTDGFEIARKDLAMRGPGEFLGTRQHGLSEFAAAALAMDMTALEEAKEAAQEIISGHTTGAEQLKARAREKLEKLADSVAPN